MKLIEKDGLVIFIASENGKWHMSCSRKDRNPYWEEIRNAWYDNVPNAEHLTGAMYFPPKSEYVNVMEHCFHIYEV